MILPLHDPIVRQLIAAAEKIPVVDTHQHLGPEAPVETDLCRLLVDDNYLATDLVTAGMDQITRDRIADTTRPLAERWQLIAPFWERSRFSSYAETVLLTLRTLYGAKRLDASEIPDVSARLAADMRAPDLFRRILAEYCGIDTVLTQGQYFRHDRPRFFTVARPLDRADFSPGGPFESDARELGVELRSAADVAPAMDAILRAHHARGAVGFKAIAYPWTEPDHGELQEGFRQRGAAFVVDRTPDPLIRLYLARMAEVAAELNIPVAVHTGAPWTNWLDFRAWEPTAMIPFLNRYRATRFDFYHAGIPYGTQASLLGKTFPNVWHNLCWTHAISADLAMRSISEWLDLVPRNKVSGFGGDYQNRTVVLTCGHMAMARQNMARVLAWRIHEGRMDMDDATQVLQAWFSDNPRQLYRLAKWEEQRAKG